jgi:hypothetical protein
METRVGLEPLVTTPQSDGLRKYSTYTLSRSFFSILADELLRRGLHDFKNQEVCTFPVLADLAECGLSPETCKLLSCKCIDAW